MQNKAANCLRFLFFGDLVGKPGRMLFQKWAPVLKERYHGDAIIVNGENSASTGKGITPKIAQALHETGALAITTGNHVWAQREIYNFLNETPYLLRPLNFPSQCPGKGYYLGTVAGQSVAVVSLQGRIFMQQHLDCPFKAMQSLLTYLQTRAKIIFVDFHAETTSEKMVMAHFLDGAVSGLYGTHTHAQTADERILPQGTSFISDLGYSGALNSSLGFKVDGILNNFLTQMPVKHEVESTGPFVMSGLVVDVDPMTGKTVFCERIRLIDEDLAVLADAS